VNKSVTALFSDKLITIIGGSGFIGRHLVRALTRKGYRVRVAVRRPELAVHIKPLGRPGQISLAQANVRYPATLVPVCEGAEVVVNLVGVLYSAGAQTFDAVHVFGAEASAKAARIAKARVFIQMSALGADSHSASDYARSKALGEARARAAFPDAIVVRPSIVFGPEDDFFNRFAAMARFSPVIPLVGARTKFQPVYVGDVAEALSRLAEMTDPENRSYEFGGPEVFSLRQLVEYTLATTDRRRLLLPLPWGVARTLGTVLGMLPKPMLTADQVELLKSDNIVSAESEASRATLRGLGITPEGIEAIVPAYLYRYRKAGQFTQPSGA
jgi:NADH dehydrogenase